MAPKVAYLSKKWGRGKVPQPPVATAPVLMFRTMSSRKLQKRNGSVSAMGNFGSKVNAMRSVGSGAS